MGLDAGTLVLMLMLMLMLMLVLMLVLSACSLPGPLTARSWLLLRQGFFQKLYITLYYVKKSLPHSPQHAP